MSLRINLMGIRTDEGLIPHDETAFINAYRIDTITGIEGKQPEHHVPEKAKAVIRYIDVVKGYRFFYTAETAEYLAKEWGRIQRGEGPPEFDYLGGD